ncbi:MAG: DUF6279 family lipoprotein [Pseudomonadales bacterium]
MKTLRNLKQLIGLGAILLLSSACSSDFMIRTMYADLGDSFVDDVHEYADFDKQQSEMIENVAGDLHHWHRTTQLPIYAQFLRDTANDSASGLLLQRNNIEGKFERLENAMHTMENAPWPMIGDLFSSLSLTQIAQMEESLAQETDDMQREVERSQSSRGKKKMMREQRAEIEGMFTDVLDVPLNKAQKLRIETMVEEWQGDLSTEVQLEQQWNAQFIELLRQLNRETVSIEPVLDHLMASSTLHENAAPEQAENDKEILIDGLHDIIRSMNNEQHQRMRVSLNRYADLIDTL